MAAETPNLDTICCVAIDIASTEERAAFIHQACGADRELQACVEKLVAAHFQAGSFLEEPARVPEATAAFAAASPDARIAAAHAECPGTTIGPYKLLQQIGEGGMGVVYMAEQQEPVRRKVALKIIKPGMDSQQVIARFEAERQALAMMEHQNIARVLDAGTTASSRPYFVMELVHGVPITQFCDDNKLTPRERLALFVPVCHAIQHAHQKGIIHRDVKPSNVLVTMYDDRPVPKVIDFGVAKAVEQRLTENTMFTRFGTLVGTFEYMSPEQAEMNAFGVDTRSDIYSLGVLLYELLTGTTPLERTRLRAAALDEMVRLIKDEEAPRPSVRLSSSNNLPKIAAARKTDSARLSKLVRGEIDWIVMKCLEKDRSRRYITANGLARDVERYLADEPVEACPPSASYRLRKVACKYKKALATAAAFAVLLVAGMVLSTSLAVWATSAEREANRQRIASEAAKQEAVEARGEADKQRDEARLTAYASGLGLAQRAWDENKVSRARELLAEVPREAAGRDLRGFEWYYLSRLCHTEVPTLKGHAAEVWSVAFSPDGQRLASASRDKTVKVWDSATGKEMVWLQGHSDTVTSVTFSPDGRRLASGCFDKTVKIWDSTTGKQLISLEGHPDQVLSVAFSPDGRRLASASQDRTVKIWDSATGEELISFKAHTAIVWSVAFSPDGQRLASSSQDGTAKIWDSATGKELLAINGHAGAVLTVAFSPDGRLLASGSTDKTVRIWDSAAGRELLSLPGHTHSIRSVAFSPDGRRVASGSYDGTVKIWDSATGTELVSFKDHTNLVRSVAFSPDGQRLASGSADSTVKIWDSATGTEPFSLKGHRREACGVAFSPDGRRLVSGAKDRTVRIWDSATGQELVSLRDHGKAEAFRNRTSSVARVAFSPDGRRVASGITSTAVKVWDSATGQELLSLKGHAGLLCGVAFSPDGRHLASGSADTTVRIWDIATGQERLSLKGHTNGVNDVAFSPDGRHLASASADKTVNIWDSVTGQERRTLKGHVAAVQSVAFSLDGRHLASGSWDNTVKTWNSATGKELLSFKGHAGAVYGVAFSPDGRRLASGSYDRTVKIWDIATGRELLSLEGHGGEVLAVAFSPDGQRLASTNRDGFIDLWETSVSSEVQEHRATYQVVADLFRQLGLRADILERLGTAPGLSPSQRQAALAAAQTHPEDPSVLDDLAWELVKVPGREMSDYRQALRFSQEACQLEPNNGVYLNTLGVAQYRVGNDDKALETLLRADDLHQVPGSNPFDLAFLAMTQQHLGDAQEAQAYLHRLRECMKTPRWAQHADAQGVLREAEALLAQPATPRGK